MPSDRSTISPSLAPILFQGTRHKWHVAPATPSLEIARLGDHPPLIAHLLCLRGIRTPLEAAAFLSPDAMHLEDPMLLPDIHKAIDRLHAAKQRGDLTAVYGDFDADGVTGTALLAKALRRFGLNVVSYIPHRVTEGHGLNADAVDALHGKGVRLVVTVDCGVTDVEAISRAGALGIDTIVTDHHLTASHLPDAVAIINPHAPHSRYPFDHLTGVGMTLKLAQALLAPIHGDTWAEGLMELAAIGTITDMAPLLGENRAIVALGIQHLRNTSSTGLLALMRAARIDPAHVDAEGIGFGIGPRLNAAGRLDHADIAYELLVTDDPARAASLVAELDEHNSVRRSLTETTLEEARSLLPASVPPLIMVGSPSFNPGVIGLTAGKLAEEFGAPAVVYTLDADRVHASCRSALGFHWAEALEACEDLLIRHGGHAQAAGFTCLPEAVEAVKGRLEAIAAERLGEQPVAVARALDAEVSLPSLMGSTFQALRRMEPFGMGNPTPLFLMRDATVERVSTMGAGNQHLRLTLRAGSAIWDAVAFRQQWTAGTDRADIVFSLGMDRWNGTERLRLQVEDYAPCH